MLIKLIEVIIYRINETKTNNNKINPLNKIIKLGPNFSLNDLIIDTRLVFFFCLSFLAYLLDPLAIGLVWRRL